MLLHKALRDAVRLRLLPNSPASEVEKPRPGKKRMQVYDEAQAKALLDAAASHRLYALFVLAQDTGMRQGELFALCWQDVDFDAGSVFIQRSLEEINGKHRIKEADRRRKDGRLFPTRRGRLEQRLLGYGRLATIRLQ